MSTTMSSAARTEHSPAERVSSLILEYAARIGREQKPDRLLQLNADLARDISGADRCSLWLIDEGNSQLWTTVAHGMQQIRIPAGQGMVGAAIARNEPIVANDVDTVREFSASVDRDSGYRTRSAMTIPLRTAEGKVIGALQALNKPGGFSGSELPLLELAAAYSASVIETERLRRDSENARLLYRDLEIARDVQSQLFPQTPPLVRGMEHAACCRPARMVGGDYYDLLRLPGGELAFTIGDVSGKGVPAALLMAGIQSSMRTLLSSPPQSLAALMSNLNRLVFSSSTADRYSTLFLGIVDPARGTLRYVNAGHNPPLLRNPHDTGNARILDAGGPPVGLLAAAPYVEASVDLNVGDVILCYSDGVSEAMNAAGEIWDMPRLESVFAASCCGAPEEVLRRVLEGADTFAAGAPQADDMTILVLRMANEAAQ